MGSKSLSAAQACLACAALLLFAGPLPAHAQEDGLGQKVFTAVAEPPCALCHALKAAGSTGEIGPNLDEMKPSEDRVREAVKGGVGAMPPFADTLSAEQIDAVSKFVAKSAKQ